MMTEVTNPHDSFFKSTFSDVERSREFFGAYLPQKLVAELDLRRLHLDSGSFVDEKLRHSHSDLLFSTILKDGEQASIYLLFEHQSTPEKDMPFRLLRYLVRIWEQHRKQRGERHSLPFIVPVVLYHGKTDWTVPRFFAKTLNCQRDIGVQPTDFEYILVDLSRIPDQEIRTRIDMALALAMFAHIRDDDFPGFIRKMVPLIAELRRSNTGLEYIATVLRYVYHTRDEDELDDLIDLLREADPVSEEVFMTTIAEHFIQQGQLTLAQTVLLEDLQDIFGEPPSVLTERIQRVQDHQVLLELRRQLKSCRTLDDFEQLLDRNLQ